MFQALSIKRVATLALLAGLVGCSSPPTSSTTAPQTANSSPASSASKPGTPSANAPLVVATNTVVCGLTKQIAANTVNLKCLIDAGSDPHVYEPKPEDSKAIETAKLIFYGGYDFEPTLIRLIKATSNPAPKIAVHEVAVPTPQQFEEDGKSVVDPHVWQNAQNGLRIAEVIRDNLATLEPNNAKLYADNASKLATEIGQLDTWIKTQVATIPTSSRKLVTTHDAFGYYSKAYSIPIEGALGGISTEEAPTATRVKDLVKDVKTTNVSTIFAEVTINPKLIESVAKEAGVKVSDRELFADGLGAPGSEGETYTGMLTANTKTIVEGLSGKYTPFQPKISSRSIRLTNDAISLQPIH